MKKILYILSAVLLLSGCLTEVAPEPQPVDGKVTIGFGVTLPEAQTLTKALGEQPTINDLYVAVFNEGGYISEYVKAEPEGTTLATQNEVRYNYKVTLTTSDDPCILHFMGNGPASFNYGSEITLITALRSFDGTDAYWQRIEVPNLKKNADGELNATSLALLSDVPLVRNFAKITMTASDDANFVIKQFRLYNTPTRGSFAPYVRTTSHFVENYQTKHLADLNAEGFYGYTPVDTPINTDLGPIIDVQGGDAPIAYIYEREATTVNPTFVLVYGTYTDIEHNSTDCYYKVALRDSLNNPVALLRNYNYKINIKRVETIGSNSWEAARASAGSGEISASTEAEHLTNISDGYSRLFVSETSQTIVSGDPFPLKFRFLKYDGTEHPVNGNNDVTVRLGEGDLIESYTIDATDGPDLYRTIMIDPVAPTVEKKTQKIYITGTDFKGDTLQRAVSFTLMQRQVMTVQCIPDAVKKVAGETVGLNITIPGGLPTNVFPLNMIVEADALSLTTSELSVQTEKSISLTPSRAGKPSYQFVRVIPIDEYDAAELDEHGNKTFYCEFRTNTTESASLVYVANQYFYTANTEFENYVPGNFLNLSFPAGVPMGYDRDFTFSFKLDGAYIPASVMVDLNGAYPDESHDELTYDTATGKYKYRLPAGYTSGDVITLHLKTGTAVGACQVTLDANRYTTASKEQAPDYRIRNTYINVLTDDGSTPSSVSNLRLYSSEPTIANIKATNPSNRIGNGQYSIGSSGGHYYLPEIDLNSAGLSLDATVWFGYSKNGKYYTASAPLIDLLGATTSYDYDLLFSKKPNRPVSLAVSGDNKVSVGKTITLTATVTYEDGTSTPVTANWTSDNTSRATVGAATGVVTGVAKGDVTITASYTEDGVNLTSNQSVNVNNKKTYNVPKGALTLKYGNNNPVPAKSTIYVYSDSAMTQQIASFTTTTSGTGGNKKYINNQFSFEVEDGANVYLKYVYYYTYTCTVPSSDFEGKSESNRLPISLTR